MSEFRIAAERRTEFGKGAARRIRRADKVPAVLYGHGQEPRHVTLPGHELMLALKSANVLLTLETEDGSELALPKEVQRDPLRGTIDHVDLVAVRRGEKVVVDVPLHLVGEVASGGLLTQDSTTLQVQAEATHIPESVEVDLSTLEVGSQLTAKDVALPAGVQLEADPDLLLLAITVAPSAEQVEAELSGVEAELGIVHEAPTTEGDAGPDSGDAAPAEDSGAAAAAGQDT